MKSVIIFAFLLTFQNLLIDVGINQYTGNKKGEVKKVFSFTGTENLSRTIMVTGKVTQSYSYCGGANPPKEIISNLAIPVAYPNKKFYIREGKLNNPKTRIVKNFTTDSSGSFSIRLAPGTYAIIVEEQLQAIKLKNFKKQFQVVNEKCLLEWWVKPYYVLEVSNQDIKLPDFNFHHPCFIDSDIPCISYTGPMPP